MKIPQVVREARSELGDIPPPFLAAKKLTPRHEQVFYGYDILKGMKPPARFTLSLSLDNATIIQRIKEGYLAWIAVVVHIPKGQRFTIGTRIENTFLDLLELAHAAYFIAKEHKEAKVAACISKLDSLKLLVQVAWEAHVLTPQQYATLGEKLMEIGKMLGGWKNSLANPEKKNRTL